VKNNAGFIILHSEVGKGTSFEVFIPAAEAAMAEIPTEQRKPPPRGNGELVMIVDDELSVREISKEILESHGYRTIAAHDGAEGISLFLHHGRDVRVVLTDMMMPVMDGATLIKTLKKMDPGVPIIAASGMSDFSLYAENHKDEIKAFLLKPFDADRLLHAIQLVLRT
jgi:CheY-like chemotaxis protein